MLIGVDMDDVLVDFVSAYIKYHNESYNTNITKEEVYTYNLWEVFKEPKATSIKKLDDFYNTDYFKNIRPVIGAIDHVDRLKKNNEIIIITSRPIKIREETERWLNKYLSGKFSRLYFAYNHYIKEGEAGKKSEICTSLGINILIEDSLEYATECALKNIRVMLFDRPWNKSKDLKNISRVYSWKEVLNNIK